jgi:hypothetical protein
LGEVVDELGGFGWGEGEAEEVGEAVVEGGEVVEVVDEVVDAVDFDVCLPEVFWSA